MYVQVELRRGEANMADPITRRSVRVSTNRDVDVCRTHNPLQKFEPPVSAGLHEVFSPAHHTDRLITV